MSERIKTNRVASEMATTNSPLLYNHWYMAGWNSEFGEGLHERTFLSRSLVIFRKQDGELVALQNRCAHRSFPLASGILEGDAVRCGYHGVKFNANGLMVEAPPGQDQCPRLSIRKYPMRTKGPIAWIWMGEPERAATTPLPSLPWLEDTSWTTISGLLPVAGNWLLLAENLMDLTHIPYVHGATFNYSKEYAATPMQVMQEGETIYHERHNAPGYHRNVYVPTPIGDRMEAAGVNTVSRIRFVSPALTIGSGELNVVRTEMMDQGYYSWQICNLMTPIDEKNTNYWWAISRNYEHDNEELTIKMRDLNLIGLAEDKVAAELVQKLVDSDRTPFEEVHFKTDKAGVLMRRIVQKLVQREEMAC
ncbi:Rieske 2Fe-2S domain-containing protein [Novosphingobium sp. BL-52-GroH]|uniref:Rieske 2Fe-2S domain-containing protein n=1 Tax=Novosphingobium sp. BL-52-GroH TaxID=3349877 RepID=UPI00384DB573